jgi:hypothetical protein
LDDPAIIVRCISMARFCKRVAHLNFIDFLT